MDDVCSQARQLAASAGELAETDKQKARCIMLEARACHALRSARNAFQCYTQVRLQMHLHLPMQTIKHRLQDHIQCQAVRFCMFGLLMDLCCYHQTSKSETFACFRSHLVHVPLVWLCPRLVLLAIVSSRVPFWKAFMILEVAHFRALVHAPIIRRCCEQAQVCMCCLEDCCWGPAATCAGLMGLLSHCFILERGIV